MSNIVVKTCIKCGVIKPLSEYYTHPKMADGHLGKCKECYRRDALNNRIQNIERVHEYDRNRPNHVERTRKVREKATKDRLENPSLYNAKRAKVNRKYRENNRQKARARDAVFYAVSTGKMVKPSICQDCGKNLPLESHHEDHSRPLEVIWLCDSCHKKADNKLREKKRKGALSS